MRASVVASSLLLACASTADETERPSPPEAAAHHDTPSRTPTESNAPDATAADAGDSANDPWHPLVREVSSSFSSWGVVDNQFHWAPGMCAMPSSGVLHHSEVQADLAHGGKVFLLHAFDAMAYWKATPVTSKLPQSLARKASPLSSRADVRQVLVKESFVPKPLDGGGPGRFMPAKKGDAFFGQGDPLGLFVMAQLDPTTPGTDAGWIYATVSPAGDVTAAGDLAACRECHAKEADRVFGVPLQWRER